MSAEEQTTAKDHTIAPVHHSGFVTLVGRPNAGKSSLLNALLGKKVAITSDTAQTTRHRFRAVLTREDYQLVVVDTPGLHKPHDTLGQELNTTALKSLDGVDVVAMLIDASKEVGTGDEWVAAQLERVQANKVAVLSKIDVVDEEALEKQLDAVRALAPWDSIIALSALTGDNLDTFLETVVAFLPE
ncbi:MAG: GTPase Era, partial [Coriobacteriaceae bacterium]|nr:GTPase Era [Coriobacteriaceae bacterium]